MTAFGLSFLNGALSRAARRIERLRDPVLPQQQVGPSPLYCNMMNIPCSQELCLTFFHQAAILFIMCSKCTN